MFAFVRFVHVLSVALWLGVSLSFMVWGRTSREATLEVWAYAWSTMSFLQRSIVAPACLIATLSGILLTVQLAGMHFDMGGAMWLMAMQLLGIVAAVLTLAIATPLAARMGVLAERSREKGAREAAAEGVRKRLAAVGTVAGVLMLLAFYFGEMKP